MHKSKSDEKEMQSFFHVLFRFFKKRSKKRYLFFFVPSDLTKRMLKLPGDISTVMMDLAVFSIDRMIVTEIKNESSVLRFCDHYVSSFTYFKLSVLIHNSKHVSAPMLNRCLSISTSFYI